MTNAGKSLFCFGFYVLLLGLLFIAIPESLILLAKLPPLPVGWARVIGFLALIIAACDIISGRKNVQVIIQASVFTRIGFAAGILLLVIFKQMPLTTILFGAVDALGALWTAMALKADERKQRNKQI